MGRDWVAVRGGGYAVPRGRSLEELVAELEELLTSPDPHVRDDVALPVLAAWVERGVLDEMLEDLGTRCAARLQHPAVHARSFAALALGEVVGRAAVSPARLVRPGVLRAWLVETILWYRDEADLRPWDPDLGWLHAAAHGADLLGVLALAPQLAADDVRRVSGALAGRLDAPSTPLFTEGEDARIAQALYAAAARADLEPQDVARWFADLRVAVAEGVEGSERTPAWLSNTVRALQMLHVLVGGAGALTPTGDAVSIVHGRVVRDGVVEALAPWWPSLRP